MSLEWAMQPLREDCMATEQTVEHLLDERAVAQLTGMSLGTLRRWRVLNRGPRFIKLSAAVRYRPEDIRKWLESRPAGGSTEAQ
jgi:predicted DNA-binding transcriptional regulator AlpA